MSYSEPVRVPRNRRRAQMALDGPFIPIVTSKLPGVPPGHDIYIRNHVLKFPHPEMYPAQAHICDRLISAMNISKTERSVAFLESPTGTGKTLALLTAALGWQQKVRDEGGLEPLARYKAPESKDDDPTPPLPSTQPTSQHSASTTNRAASISEILVDISDLEEHEDENNHQSSNPPSNGASAPTTEKQKESELSEAPLSPEKSAQSSQRRKRAHVEIELENMDDFVPEPKRPAATPTEDAPASSESSNPASVSKPGDKTAEKKDPTAPPSKSAPTIFYATRTHSQVQKAISELYSMPYRPAMTALGARDNFCLDEEVKVLPKGVRENACRTKVRRHQCHHHSRREVLAKAKELAPDGSLRIWDLEDMTMLGRSYEGCGYYAARDLVKTADIVFCPYNYLVDLAIVAPYAEALRNSIVIIDEAHNIEDMCRNESSVTMTLQSLNLMIDSIKRAMNLPYYYPRQWHYRTHGWAQEHILREASAAIPSPNAPQDKAGKHSYSLFSQSSAFYTGPAQPTEELGYDHRSTRPSTAAEEAKKKRQEDFANDLLFCSNRASHTPGEIVTRLTHTHWLFLEKVEGSEMPPMYPQLVCALRHILQLVCLIRDWLDVSGRAEYDKNVGKNGNDGYAAWKDDKMLALFREHFKLTPLNIREWLNRWEQVHHLIDEITEWLDKADERGSKPLDKARLLAELRSSPTYHGFTDESADLLDPDNWGGQKAPLRGGPNWTVFEGSQSSDLDRFFRIMAFTMLSDCQYLEDFRVIVEKPKEFNNAFPDDPTVDPTSDLDTSQHEEEQPEEEEEAERRPFARGVRQFQRTISTKPNIQLNLLCLNPACLFRELLIKTRMVALVSGTLSPFASMRAELGVEPIVAPSSIIQFSTQHIIKQGSRQLMALRLNAFPSDINYSLLQRQVTSRASYEQPSQALKWVHKVNSDPRSANALGWTLLSLLPTIPDGTLVFFTSYKHMKFCVSCWSSGDGFLWKALNKVKPFFIEPSAGAGGTKVKLAFKQKYESYLSAVDNVDASGSSRGAVFLGVARGKIAEGIDFADRHARAVFVVGIPYPVIKEPSIAEKREWNATRFLEEKTRLGGASVVRRDYNKLAERSELNRYAKSSVTSLLDTRSRNTNERPTFAMPPRPSVNIASLPFKTISDWHQVDSINETLYLDDRFWYEVQAFRAVNQTLGRCVRHANDYGAIIFLDCRFETMDVEKHLSGWVRGALTPASSLISPLITQLESFYKDNAHLNKPRKTAAANATNVPSAAPAQSPFASAANGASSSLNRAASWSPHATEVHEGLQRRSTDPLAVAAAPAPRGPVNAFDRLMPFRQQNNQPKVPPPMPERASSSAPAVQNGQEDPNGAVSVLKKAMEEVQLEGPLLKDDGCYEKDDKGVLVPILKSPFARG